MRKTALILLTALFSHSLFAEEAVSKHFKFSQATLYKLRKNADAKTLSALDAYEEAVQLEKEISEIYKEIKATKLSIIQRQLLEKSLKDTLAPVSKRLTLNREELSRERTDAKDVGEYKEKLKEIMFETDNIVANATKMLDEFLSPPVEEIELLDINVTPQEEMTEEQKAAQAEIQMLMEEILEALNKMDVDIKEVITFTTEAEKLAALKKIGETLILKSTKESNSQAKAVGSKITEALEIDDDKKQDALLALTKNIESALNQLVKTENDYDEKLKQENKDQKVAVEKAKEELAKSDRGVKPDLKGEELLKDTQTEIAEDLAAEIKKSEDAKKEVIKAILKLKEMEELIEVTEKKVEKIEELKKVLQVSSNSVELQELEDQMKIEKIQALQLLSMETQGKHVDLTRQMRGTGLNKPITDIPAEDLPPSIELFEDHYGNKIVKQSGKGAIWFYLDKWYIIGPFDNAGRKNIETVFPPQSMVDLNATYTGKDGALLKWEYDTFDDKMIYPPGYSQYAIYYAYTELYSDEDRDVWITVGSDDRSDIWVNELPVWRSSNQLKSWSIDEGYRKIYLKKGINKILYRIENGHYALGFSLLVNIYNPKDKTKLNALLNEKRQRKSKKK